MTDTATKNTAARTKKTPLTPQQKAEAIARTEQLIAQAGEQTDISKRFKDGFGAKPLTIAVMQMHRDVNLNGDPDAGNRPRETASGVRYATPGSFKRKIRDVFAEADLPQFYTTGTFLDMAHRAAAESIGVQPGTPAAESITASRAVTRALCASYLDARLFGLVAGNESATGCVQFMNTIDLAGCPTEFNTITRGSNLMKKGDANMKDVKREGSAADIAQLGRMARKGDLQTMGSRWFVPFSVTLTIGMYDPRWGMRNGVTSDDLEALFEAMTLAAEHSRTASRPYSRTLSVLMFEHSGTAEQAASAGGIYAKLGRPVTGPRTFEPTGGVFELCRNDGLDCATSLDEMTLQLRLDRMPPGLRLVREFGLENMQVVGAEPVAF